MLKIYRKILPVKSGNKIHFVKISNIKYILAARFYIEIYSFEKRYVERKSLKKIIGIIEGDSFVRIHRSTIINKDYVKEIIKTGHGEIDVIMDDGSSFRVGKSYKDLFLTNIGIL